MGDRGVADPESWEEGQGDGLQQSRTQGIGYVRVQIFPLCLELNNLSIVQLHHSQGQDLMRSADAPDSC